MEEEEEEEKKFFGIASESLESNENFIQLSPQQQKGPHPTGLVYCFFFFFFLALERHCNCAALRSKG